MERARRIANRATLSRLLHQAKHSPIPHHHPHYISSARYISSLPPSIFPSRSQPLPSSADLLPRNAAAAAAAAIACQRRSISVESLKPTDTFPRRHNSATPEEQVKMAEACGFPGLDALVDATVPKAIRAPPMRFSKFDEELLCCVASIPYSASALDFLFNSFKPGDLNLVDDARVDASAVRLTNDSKQYSLGRAFHPAKLTMLRNPTAAGSGGAVEVSSFSTSFVFSVLPEIPSSPGFGLAFVPRPPRSRGTRSSLRDLRSEPASNTQQRQSKELLELEQKKPSFLESNFLVRKKEEEEDKAVRTKAKKKKERDEVPGKEEAKQHVTATIPTSQVLGKVQDFLGVISKANEKLQLSSQGSSLPEYDIEVLSANETEYIEMDLLLGVADLQTPEAVAVAETAIGGSHEYLPLFDENSSSDSEENSDEEHGHITADTSLSHNLVPKPDPDDSSGTIQSRKRLKITELN